MIPVRADSTRLAFDRASGAIEGAGIREKALIKAFQTGARITSSWAHRGFGFGCRALRRTVPNREMYVRLNGDAVFAFPFGDEYWSTILDRKYVYELDIDLFLRGSPTPTTCCSTVAPTTVTGRRWCRAAPTAPAPRNRYRAFLL
ncbi:hypothetical protein [Bradyrhizobium sp. JYMT SZCCT0428]|uniref:hypothetical protein n=1 Tax=Bradyrhizobium sp. JYMT SZCCT0428 TaxID=2807673 RepID=UPI0039089E26